MKVWFFVLHFRWMYTESGVSANLDDTLFASEKCRQCVTKVSLLLGSSTKTNLHVMKEYCLITDAGSLYFHYFPKMKNKSRITKSLCSVCALPFRLLN
jgi:hypothetical protein